MDAILGAFGLSDRPFFRTDVGQNFPSERRRFGSAFSFRSLKTTLKKNILDCQGQGTFSLSQLKAATLIIEVFSMYCPHCQREAPIVNELHGLIEKDASLKKGVRLVGIGIGNTPFEVEVFREKFKVPFPLFADDSFQLQKVSKDRFRTPTFIVAGIRPHGGFKILDVHVGHIKDLAKYLENVKKLKARK